MTVLKGAIRAAAAIAWIFWPGCDGGDRAKQIEAVARWASTSPTS